MGARARNSQVFILGSIWTISALLDELIACLMSELLKFYAIYMVYVDCMVLYEIGYLNLMFVIVDRENWLLFGYCQRTRLQVYIAPN